MVGNSHNIYYYATCMTGGIISCGSTHSIMTPIDLVKCNMQAYPDKYLSMGDGLFRIYEHSGFSTDNGLYVGAFPTFIGYALQGTFKFGFYEIFKDFYSFLCGAYIVAHYTTIIYLFASFSAEFIADIFLCPFESIKVRMQTSKPEDFFPPRLYDAFQQILRTEGYQGLYKGLVPLWCRQIPYTMVKFTCFESIIRFFYIYIFTAPKDSYSPRFQLIITFISGFIAGVFCAIVSHPADTIMTKLNQSDKANVVKIIKSLGWNGIWRGLTPRIVMIGTLTAFQWWIYDLFKTFMGLKTTGGH